MARKAAEWLRGGDWSQDRPSEALRGGEVAREALRSLEAWDGRGLLA